MKLVASPTSPFARKIRVILLEKGFAFDWHESIPWNPDTDVPLFNPLGKVPALVADDGRIWFDSPVIAEYLETLPANKVLIPTPSLRAVEVRQIEALADGTCEAAIAIFLEQKRESARQSPDWIARQEAKVAAGLEALAAQVGSREFVHDSGFSLGDIAIVCFLEWFDFRFKGHGWRQQYSSLAAYTDRIGQRASFLATRPG